MNEQDEGKRLATTGWQSWSTKTRRFKLFNHRDFPRKNPSTRLFPKENIETIPPVTGWCSWYAFYHRIDEAKILEQTKYLEDHRSSVPLEYILIDDGWTTWGDWQNSNQERFPSGLDGLAAKISSHGLKSGIWLAPFLVDPKSNLFKEHRDWLVHRSNFLVEGFKIFNPIIDRFMPYRRYILNIKNKDARRYLIESIKKLADQGFTLIKLDFLYALHFDPHLSMEEADQELRSFLLEVKRRLPGIHLVACGSPLIPAAGAVHSMRVGPDNIAPNIDGWPIISKIYNTHKIKKSIRSIRARMFTKTYWNIDPDVFVCRPSLGLSKKTIMNLQQVIKDSKGNIFLGDDLTKLSQERIKEFIEPLFR
ncbi:MAG TPA: alpha-galactosidase [bacterium]|nr:alpha-galactosidase [bacterium]